MDKGPANMTQWSFNKISVFPDQSLEDGSSVLHMASKMLPPATQD